MPMLLPRLRSVAAFCVALLLAPAASLAATATNRVVSIDRGSASTLAHNVSGRLKQASDEGQAPLSRRLEGVTLHFSRTAAQQAALNQLLIDQQTPGSARYRQWLTPAQFGAQFGLSPADLSKVSAWLAAQNLTITYTAPSSSLITVSGTIAQLQQAFGTSIHTVRWNGEQHVANVTNPSVPLGLANVLSGITGLNDFRLRARAKPRSLPANGVKASFTSTTGGTTSHYLSPSDAQTIYNAKPLLASAINGTGARIAVMGQTDISTTDFAAFRAAGALPAATLVAAGTTTFPASGPFLAVVVTGTDPGTSSPDFDEAMLDIEWAGALAPNAGIIYVNSSNVLGGSLAYAVTSDLAPILSISYGACEPDFSASDIYSFNSLLQEASAQGQTLVAPGGDSGATDCDYQSVTAADGLAVDFPASSPNATGVGGTMFNDTAANWGATNATDGSSALGYIPETVWNETSTRDTLASGGGGASVYFTKPSWQVGTGVPADLSRDVPDLALNAGADHDGYLVCVSGSCTNSQFNTTSVYGGTSVSVPSFAGMLALIEQKIGATGGLGNINPVLYGLGGTASFHDITTGTNNSPCVNGSPNCQNVSSIGYPATVGYDLASGWGSVDVTNLANAWRSAVPTSTTSPVGSNGSLITVSLPASAQSCAISTGSITVNVSVATLQGSAGPTGTVQLLVDGVITGLAVPLSGSTASLTASTAGLSSGGHSIAALYSGDATFSSSKGYLAASLISSDTLYVQASPSIIDFVSTTSPDFSLTPCLPSINVASGAASSPLTLTATSFNGFSGLVTFSASTDFALAAQTGFSVPSVTISSSAAGTATFTLSAFTTSTAAQSRKQAAHQAPLSRRGLLGTGAGTAALASVLFLVLPRRRRSLSLLVALLSVGLLGLGGCGGGSSVINGGTPPVVTKTNTPAGSYLVNITATGNNSVGQALVHSTVVIVNVQ